MTCKLQGANFVLGLPALDCLYLPLLIIVVSANGPMRAREQVCFSLVSCSATRNVRTQHNFQEFRSISLSNLSLWICEHQNSFNFDTPEAWQKLLSQVSCDVDSAVIRRFPAKYSEMPSDSEGIGYIRIHFGLHLLGSTSLHSSNRWQVLKPSQSP